MNVSDPSVFFKKKHRDAIGSIVADLWKSSEASISPSLVCFWCRFECVLP